VATWRRRRAARSPLLARGARARLGVAPSFARNPTLGICRHSSRTRVGR
jgi:hypothetical protein